MKTLVLNADTKFLRVVSGFRGIILDMEQKVNVLAYYDKFMHSQYLKFQIPAVVLLKDWKNIKKKITGFPPSKKNLLSRDNFRCQYCGVKLTTATMTKDHVIPLSKGGNSTFSNLVSCCKACNSYKDNKTPEEIGLKLFKPPRELTNQEKVEVIIKSAKAKERKVWLECLEKNNINLW